MSSKLPESPPPYYATDLTDFFTFVSFDRIWDVFVYFSYFVSVIILLNDDDLSNSRNCNDNWIHN